jgi:MFS transporter, DHA1 family, tetracycline resistance protein
LHNVSAPHARPHRQPAVGFIFVTLVMIVLGWGIITPVMPGLITEFEGGDTSAGAHTFGWIIGVFAAMQFLAAPLLGVLSDRFGRRKIILVALAGSALDYLVLGWAPTLGWLFGARVMAGLLAGAISACNAYVADVTPPEQRARGFGLLGAAFGIGFVLGPVVGGFLGDGNLRRPFFAAAACVALNWLYGLFVLPESLPPERRRPFEWRRANPIGGLLNLRRFHGILGLAAMHFLYMLASTMLQSTWVLYTGYRYGWTPRQVGLSLMLVGIMAAIVQGRLVGPILGRLGEKRGLLIGLGMSGIVMVLYGVAPQGWMIFPLIVIGSFSGIAGPAAQALITKRIPADEQGGVQGALSSLGSLASVFAPPIAAWSFGACIGPQSALHLPGIAFFEAAITMAIALGLAWRALRSMAPNAA